jgi:hypothetical protein
MQKITYYFRDADEKALHIAIMHAPKIVRQNKPRATLGRESTTFFRGRRE